jgi:hypothetical protein
VPGFEFNDEPLREDASEMSRYVDGMFRRLFPKRGEVIRFGDRKPRP